MKILLPTFSLTIVISEILPSLEIPRINAAGCMVPISTAADESFPGEGAPLNTASTSRPHLFSSGRYTDLSDGKGWWKRNPIFKWHSCNNNSTKSFWNFSRIRNYMLFSIFKDVENILPTCFVCLILELPELWWFLEYIPSFLPTVLFYWIISQLFFKTSPNAIFSGSLKDREPLFKNCAFISTSIESVTFQTSIYSLQMTSSDCHSLLPCLILQLNYPRTH